jgi:hypothetical protein
VSGATGLPEVERLKGGKQPAQTQSYGELESTGQPRDELQLAWSRPGLEGHARRGQEAGDHAQGEARPGADPPDVRPGAAPGRGRALDLADVDLEAGTVAVVGKGKSERMPVSTSPAIPTPAPPTSTTAPSRRSAARSSIRSRTDRAAARHPDVVW